MAVARGDVAGFVIGLLSSQFHLPPSYFQEADDLAGKWLFNTASLIALGARINESDWHDKYVTPKEIAGCVTIGDIVDLLWRKIQNK